ncbi:MAG: 16S rRNA (guanine(527)-N(7))-methyltransferase RsmG [Bacteroidota bacterium]
MQPEKKTWFRTLCMRNGFTPTDLQTEQLNQYVNLLLDWNKRINLISRKDEENIWTYHILHCVSPLFKVKLMEGCRIIDIGTGGGLPGVPLKILRPDISLLCLDATRKKANAVLKMVEDLNIKNVNVIWGRAEEVGLQSEHAHKFDFAIARAVCQLNELISLSINFLKKRNYFSSFDNTISGNLIDPNSPALIAFKGGDLTQEVDSAKRQYPQVNIKEINLTLIGSEQLLAADKKILLVNL